MAFFIASQYIMISIDGDNWLMSSVYDVFYMPYSTTIGWQRGRHFADVFMSLSMRPLGQILVAFGVAPLTAFNIFSTFFTLVFYFLYFLACSLFVWLLNDKKKFQLIFIIVSLGFLLIMDGRMDYVTTGAYIGSASIVFVVWLPILYFFMYQKIFLLHKNILLQSCITFFLVYIASFQTEPSTLPVFGLTLFIAIYLYWKKKEVTHSLYIYYHIGIFLLFVPLAFCLTMISGRGQTQVNVIDGTGLFDNMLSLFHEITRWNHYVIILGIIYFVYLCCTCLKRKTITRHSYMKLITLFVGLLGVIGFSCIRVPGIWFEITFIGLILVLFALELCQSKNIIQAWCAHFAITTFIFCAILQNINIFERNFVQYHNKHTQATLIQLFQEAEKNNLREIALTQQDIARMKLEMHHLSNDPTAWPNRDISAWMKYYYIHHYIPIYVRSNEIQRNNN